jgi:hypothetical protein
VSTSHSRNVGVMQRILHSSIRGVLVILKIVSLDQLKLLLVLV